jgi:hypothetical protein
MLTTDSSNDTYNQLELTAAQQELISRVSVLAQ